MQANKKFWCKQKINKNKFRMIWYRSCRKYKVYKEEIQVNYSQYKILNVQALGGN